MPAPTFTPGDKKQDEHLNPGQRDYDRRFNDIAKAEEKGTFDDIAKNYDQTADPSQEDASIKKVQDQESNSTPSGGWRNNVSNTNPEKSKGRYKGWFKKSGPALGVGGVIGIGGLILIGLSSPSLLIVQLKETMVERFNTQLSSMEVRSNKLLYSKINGSTSGFCNTTVSIRCKFTTMSDKQIKKLSDAGIKITESEKTITGRTRPTVMTFNDQEIRPSQFASMAGTNPEFRSALKQAYNPKYAGFTGKAWSAVAARFKISKQPIDLNADEDVEAAKKKINDIAREGVEDPGTRTRMTGDAAECEQNCSGISEGDADKINSNAEAINSATKDGSAGSDVRAKLSKINSGSVTSFFKISAPLDYACQGYGALTTLSYAAKAIRSAQLVRYGYIFLNVADTIKAGKNPDTKDVELLGNIATTTIKDTSGNTMVGSATDSYGYKYAAYGDSGASENSMRIANRFMAGGGFVGQMSAVSNEVLSKLGGRENAKKTCGFLANPLVQGTSIVLGVAALFVPGANVAKVGVSLAAGAGVGLAMQVLPSLLADIVAGTVTEDIVGEETGNAITSGSGALMSDALAAQNGNGPMTKADAVAYNASQTEVQNQYIADELRTTSPFDATNPHTFLGSIAAALIPLQSSSNPLTTIGSLFATSLSSLTPTSKALSSEEYAKTLDVCTDMDVQEAGYAADPFCNVIRGIPPKYLDRDPVEVATALIEAGELSEGGQPQGEYADFIGKCITNEVPLGYENMETGFDATQASYCIVDNDNANYYLNYMDTQIDFGIDGENGPDETAAAAQPGSLPQGSAAELAEMILSSGNVTDRTGQLQQIIDGTRTNISPDILSVVAALASSNKFTISSMKRDQALSVGAGNRSLHLLGRAVDISGSSGVNGVSFGYNGHDATVQKFLDTAAALMPENCDIGVPNQAYVNATKSKVKAGCIVFVDTGTAPHIHLDVREGSW